MRRGNWKRTCADRKLKSGFCCTSVPVQCFVAATFQIVLRIAVLRRHPIFPCSARLCIIGAPILPKVRYAQVLASSSFGSSVRGNTESRVGAGAGRHCEDCGNGRGGGRNSRRGSGAYWRRRFVQGGRWKALLLQQSLERRRQ